jgi:hypothetical protein
MMNKMISVLCHASLACLIFSAYSAEAFITSATSNSNSNNNIRLYSDYSGGNSWESSASSSGGQQKAQSGRLEQVTFKIYPDGRVEEKVVGVKGQQCLEVTREINEKLGNVISTQPTEEMFEEEIQIEETVTLTETEGSGSGGGDGSTSWEGSSSW